MALGYMGRVSLGTYMWRNRVKWVKKGSKWALLSRLRTPNGPKLFLEKHLYDPILNAFVVTKWAIFKAFGTLEGPKEKPQTGLKLGLFHLFVHPMYPQLLSQAHCGRRGQQRAVCHKEVKAHRECVERPPFVHLDTDSRPFWPNKAVLGHEVCSFGRVPPHLSPLPLGTNGECLAHNVHLARAPSGVQDDEVKEGSEAMGRSNGQNGNVMCLLACC